MEENLKKEKNTILVNFIVIQKKLGNLFSFRGPNKPKFMLIIVVGLILLNYLAFSNFTSNDNSIFSNENDIYDTEKLCTEERFDGWTADEDQFMLGLSGPKPEEYYGTNERNGPTSSHFPSSPMCIALVRT